MIEGETARTKAEALAVIERMREVGFERAIHYIAERLTEGLVTQTALLEAGDIVRVGVNAFMDPVGVAVSPDYVDDSRVRAEGAARQLERLAAHKASRDEAAVASAREHLRQVAASDENILPASIALALAGGTTGEWTKTLEDAFGGRYQAPLGIDVSVAKSVTVPRVTSPVRLFLAKGGLDGHVNAVKLLAYACRQAGMEVIYSGLQQTSEAIAAGAVQEGADVIGVSVLSGAHLHIAETLFAELAKRDASDIPVVMGGIIPDADAARLRDMGVAAVFTPKDGDIGAIVAAIAAAARPAT